jgi:predicted  nucleic acid-binding Zn-ribbon protein
MSEQRIKELELQLVEANESVARLTKANTELTAGLEYAERMLKKAKRNSRSDSDSLRTQISNLQNRRG